MPVNTEKKEKVQGTYLTGIAAATASHSLSKDLDSITGPKHTKESVRQRMNPACRSTVSPSPSLSLKYL